MDSGAGLRRWLFGRLPLMAVAAVLLAALLLVADVEQETSVLNHLSLWIFALTGIALLGLLAAIISQGARLLLKVRRRDPGARMSRRMILVMFGLALPPVFIVYFFSLEFLSETVDGWFDVGTDQALQNSLEIGQLFLDLRALEAQEALRDLSLDLALSDENQWFDTLLNQLNSRGPVELSILSARGETITSANIQSASLLADLPDSFTLLQASETGSYTAAEPDETLGLKIRALELIPINRPGQAELFVQAIYALPEGFSTKATQIESTYYRYQTASYLREKLKSSFTLILSLVLVLTVLLAMLLGFGASRRLMRPLTQLTEATQDIAAGNFERRVDVGGDDELAFLGDAFNRMAQDLTTGRDALEAERRNLEILLTHLSAGVIAVDHAGHISISNDSAADILSIPLGDYQSQALSNLSHDHPSLSDLVKVIEEQAQSKRDWREEVRIEGLSNKPLVLVCRGAPLPDGTHVVVFDDVTVLTEAQREAAWAEVARRLAHEVKNPLTPIRLSAERMAMKLTPVLDEKNQALLEKTTRTIITQVEALRDMVNAFGDYAQATRIERQRHDLRQIIQSVAALYDASSEIRLKLVLPDTSVTVEGDQTKLRQTFVNLVKNAQEAGATEVTIHCQPDHDQSGSNQQVKLSFNDNGPGFPADMLERIFDPYVSGKPKGDGLGLAIVRRIIEEHGGTINALNKNQGGCIHILLPMLP